MIMPFAIARFNTEYAQLYHGTYFIDINIIVILFYFILHILLDLS